MFFILLLAAALSWKLGSGIARPIEGFARKLNELAQPDADRKQRLDDRRKDEIGQLAQSFNTLLDEIQRNETDLEEAQIQVMQSEKLASVGQLAAGVAHEINNPIGFINSNLGSLKGQVEDLLKVLATYQDAEPALAEHPELLAAIKQAKSAADLDFLQEDIVNLINESLDGVHRVKKIVDNLKDFSRVDTAEWQYANLETGLESTLNIVNNEIKYKAEVIKEFAGLPEIDCIVSQLNQVFLNLLVNAAQAIDERGTITLRTGFDEKNVWIDVADTGSGINPEHLGKIFDPFFTTKPVGKGTGLGLSLAYGIVKRHHGRMEVRSELGKGTTFRVTLPRVRIMAEATPELAQA
ncbi:MAG: ATP-binding protein [Betaproteobacteria bacterium]